MIKFYKYHGTGNDFIMIDNRGLQTQLSLDQIKHVCHRRFGIGADGLIMLQNHPEFDFEMIYYNSDGRPSSMCGNGGRCIVAFAAELGLCEKGNKVSFIAIDGYHEAWIVEKIAEGYRVDLLMKDVLSIEVEVNACILNTGSPHYVTLIEDIETANIISVGHSIRYSENFKDQGINVNLIQIIDKDIKVRTYERGVEDETWSCGTGAVASAIAAYVLTGNIPLKVHANGGVLEVKFTAEKETKFTNIHLIGSAVKVFEGSF